MMPPSSQAVEREVAYRAVSASRAKLVRPLQHQQQRKEPIDPPTAALHVGREAGPAPVKGRLNLQRRASASAAAKQLEGKANAAERLVAAAAAGSLPPGHAAARSVKRLDDMGGLCAVTEEAGQPGVAGGRSRSASPAHQGRPKVRPTTVAFGRKVEAAVVRPAARAARR
jgi:hypothetical protein